MAQWPRVVMIKSNAIKPGNTITSIKGMVKYMPEQRTVRNPTRSDSSDTVKTAHGHNPCSSIS